MDPRRWQQVRDLFERALELDEPGRRELLARDAAGDAELEREVVSLLAWHGETGGPLAATLARLEPAADRGELELGQRLDAYRLVSVLGRGGMSTVYLAERADGEFEQQVAVKLLRPGLDSEELIRRFRAERQILAHLEHPAIARLLDGGQTAAGRPYLVLERVEGERIDAFCRQLPTVAARLRLFLQVCRAVHFAHQNLVVHRDLKPSNILVQANGEPKLLDFGIAKLLAPSADGTLTAQAIAGLTPMTPEYASPEQVKGLPITTASDVYALGALLFEVLTGQPVHRLASRARAEIERVVCEEEPRRPSQVVAAAQARELAGDLDNIVLMALRKEPQRRYSSAEALAQDLERHLAGLPVAAHPDSVSYRAGKFIRRHKTALATAAAAALVLVGFVVALWVQARVLEKSEGRSKAVAAFLVRMFEGAEPGSGKADLEVARRMLDFGAKEVRASFAAEPEIKAELLGTLGTLYRKRGFLEPARNLLLEAEPLERALYGDHSVKLANTLHSLGAIDRIEGRYEEAERRLKAAMESRRQAAAASTPATADDLAELARIELRRGAVDAARTRFRSALALLESLPGAEPWQIANLQTELGSSARVAGDFAAAETILREAVAKARLLRPAPHPVLPNSLSELAAALFFQDKLDEAELVELEALELKRQLYADDHFSVGQSHNSLANIFHSQGKLEDAERAYLASLEQIAHRLGKDNPEYESALSNLATLRIDRGDYAGAEQLLREAYAILQQRGGEEDSDTAATLHNLGSILVRRGNYEESEPYVRRTVEIRRRQPGADPLSLASALHLQGRALHGLRRFDEAATAFGEGLDLYRRHALPSSASAVPLHVNFGQLEEDRRRSGEAEALYREAQGLAAKTVGRQHPQFLLAERRLLSLAIDRGEAAAVEPPARELLKALEAAFPAGHFRRFGGQVTLGRCLLAQGKILEAELLLREAHSGLAALTGPRDFDTREAAAALRELARQRGRGGLSRYSPIDTAPPSARSVIPLAMVMVSLETPALIRTVPSSTTASTARARVRKGWASLPCSGPV